MDPHHLRISCPPFGSSANSNASGMRTLENYLSSQKLTFAPPEKKTIE
jgi:hypothetical protein